MARIESKYVAPAASPRWISGLSWLLVWCSECNDWFMVRYRREAITCPYCSAEIEPVLYGYEEAH